MNETEKKRWLQILLDVLHIKGGYARSAKLRLKKKNVTLRYFITLLLDMLVGTETQVYRVIHKSLRDFRTRCATTKTDTAERSISIGRESLQVFFVLGALAYFQVPPLGGSRDEKWRSQ